MKKMHCDFQNNILHLYWGQNHIIDITGVAVRHAGNLEELLYISFEKEDDKEAVYSLKSKYIKGGKLSFHIKNEHIYFNIDIESESFSPEYSVKVFYTLPKLKKVMLSRRYSPWWSTPCFATEEKQFEDRGQLLVFEKNDRHFCMLPVPGNDFVTYLDKGYFEISTGKQPKAEVKGTYMLLGCDKDPYRSVRNAYGLACDEGYIRTPLLTDKKIPFMAKEFGWCSWNALYEKVNEADLIRKLEEFRKKNIPVKWILIDDGWEKLNKHQLVSFEADSTKFPDGLKGAVSKIKAYDKDLRVGVWITFNAYWSGIDPNGKIAKKYKDYLDYTYDRKGRIKNVIPSLDPEKAEIFWNGYFGYLKRCGIDFLKIDNQSSYPGMIREKAPVVSQTEKAQSVIEKVAKKYFSSDGAIDIINCMGMSSENAYTRHESAISRNSDDFFPNKPNDFTKHVIQNGWNSIWHGLFYCADFDMWMTHHPSAKESSVLRAISGGPIYIADEIGKTKSKYIKPFIDKEGHIFRFPQSALPTRDLFYTDCASTLEPVKLFNKVDGKFALAVFNIDSKERKVKISLDDIPDIDSKGKYLAYEYFSKTWLKFDDSHELSFDLAENDCLALSIYPFENDMVKTGDLSLYFSVLSPKTRSRKSPL